MRQSELPQVPRWYETFARNQTQHCSNNILIFNQMLVPMEVEEFGSLWVPEMLNTYIDANSKYGLVRSTETILNYLTGYSDSAINKYYYGNLPTPLALKYLLRRTDLLLRLQRTIHVT